jgi:hypothetical protein
MLNHTAATNVELRLYTNDISPAVGDTVSTYTESSAGGYTGITLTGSLWTVATTTTTSVANYAQQTFSYTTSESVYGYFVTSNGKAQVLWSERFSGSVPLELLAA